MNILNKHFDVVIKEMQTFFDEVGLKADGEIFKNETRALKVEFDDGRSLYNLYIADIDGENVGEFALKSSYLFDESRAESDAVCVGIDFVDTARKALGAKAKTKASSTAVLPTASSSGAPNIDYLTTKLLANYTALKETYKAEVEKNGKFLYLDFSSRYFVPEIRKTLDAKNKRTIKKLIDMLTDVFARGDRAASTLVVSLLAAAIGTDAERFASATAHMQDCQPLVASVNNQISLIVKDKKFAKAMGFEK